MFVANMALQAEIVVVTRDTGDKLLLRKDLDAAVTGTGRLLDRNRLLLISEGSRDLLVLLGLHLGCNALGSAVDDASVLDEALDHPVALSRAVDARVNTRRAEIVIATIADAAVEVLVFHGLVAVVAVDDPGGAYIVRLGAESEAGAVFAHFEDVKEVWSCC